MVKTEEIELLLPGYLTNSGVYSVIVVDLEGRYIYVNDTFKKRFAFLNMDFIGKPFSITLHPDDVQKCHLAAAQCIMNPQSAIKVDLRKPEYSAGEYYVSQWEFSLFMDQQHTPIGLLSIGADITEMDRVSQQLQEFAQKVETIIEEVTDGFYQLDRGWKFTKINRVAEQMLGVKREEVLGKSIWDVFSNSPGCTMSEAFNKAMHQHSSVTFEEYHPEHDKWLSTVIYPSAEGLTVFFRDVTENKKRQIVLQETERRLKAIINSTRDINLLVDRNYKILNFNQVADDVIKVCLGKPYELYADIRDYFYQEDIDTLNTYMDRVFNGEHFVLEVHRIIAGRMVFFELSYLPVFDESDFVMGCSINLKDITEKKLIESRLQEQEYMLKAIYQSTSEASTFVDKDLKIRYNNEVARSITRAVFGREAQIGDSILDYVLEEDKPEFLKYYQGALKGEAKVAERTNGEKWWQISVFPVLNECQEIIGLAHNVQDITERKNRELRILQQMKKLEDIAWLQSHELRRPVTNILGLCEIFKDFKGESEEMKSKYIDAMVRSVQELDGIIHQIVHKANESDNA